MAIRKYSAAGPLHGIFIHPLVPQRKQEKLAKVSLWPKCHWPKCHSGQSVIGQSVTSQRVTGQNVSPAKVSLAKVSLAKGSLWPKCHSGQSVPAKVSLAKVSFWPKCDSAISLRVIKKKNLVVLGVVDMSQLLLKIMNQTH